MLAVICVCLLLVALFELWIIVRLCSYIEIIEDKGEK